MKFHVMIENFWILLKGELLKGMDNKQQAITRLTDLRRTFVRHNKLFLDYKKYMNDLLGKCYRGIYSETPTGKTWYILHHAVYYASKPGKILLYSILVLNLKGSQ